MTLLFYWLKMAPECGYNIEYLHKITVYRKFFLFLLKMKYHFWVMTLITHIHGMYHIWFLAINITVNIRVPSYRWKCADIMLIFFLFANGNLVWYYKYKYLVNILINIERCHRAYWVNCMTISFVNCTEIAS